MDEPRRSWLLIVSLCVNMALIGAIAVVAWRVAHFDIAAGSGGPLSPRAVMAEFSDRQSTIQAVVAAHQDKMGALRRAAAQARREVFRELAAPDYAPQKMATALDAVAAADAAVEREAVAMTGESLATLSPDQRQAMADRLKARNRSWFFRMLRRHGLR